MKNKASALLKKVMCVLTSIAKAKSIAIKNKTNAAKARLIMFSLAKNKKVLLSSISDKIHGLLRHHDRDDVGDQSKAIVLYDAIASTEPQSSSSCTQLVENGEYYTDDNDKYPDLTHSLFDEEDDFDDQEGSIIDLVKNSKEKGEDFSLEEEIDHVADLFIKRFHKQMRLQKLESFKRFQEMLERST